MDQCRIVLSLSVMKIFGRSKQYVIFKEEERIQFHEQRKNINKYFQTCDTMWKPRQIGSKTLTFEMIEEKKILKIEDMSGNEFYLGWESVSEVWSLESVLRYRLSYSSEIQFIKKMWMLYAQEHWTKACDLKSAVERLYEELGALEFDADHEAIYEMERYYTVQQCAELRDKYKIGRKVCRRKDFCVVPVHENKNKSPVLYEEHNLALEGWCVKYLYTFIYTELFKYRQLLKRNRLFNQKGEDVNKYLITALLIHPDVSTFWNMRRELIDNGIITWEIELRLTKLVLSNKSKSNEAFAYRRWLLTKRMKNMRRNETRVVRYLLNRELTLTELCAHKSSNNYHAWNHRIWLLDNILSKFYTPDTVEYLNLIVEQLDFINRWISIHVSENTGFHYRQYLNTCFFRNRCIRINPNIKSRLLIEACFKINATQDDITYLSTIYGERKDTNITPELLVKYNNYVNLIVILLTDLIYLMKNLNDYQPQQLTVWYYRRYVVYTLLKIGYDYHQITWIKDPKLNSDFNSNNDTIRECRMHLKSDDSIEFNRGKSPKMPKIELNLMESSLLYRILSEFELRFIKMSTLPKYEMIHRGYAVLHFKYLKYVLGVYKDTDLQS
ncbi:hypothetical protein FQA39_LY17304 [Lamprigera yunnana]|nr:hypothetical protein FQA39_LY17304 [Lamprigera yunnana]